MTHKDRTYPFNFISVDISKYADLTKLNLICQASVGSAVFVKRSDRSISATFEDYSISKTELLVKLDILDPELFDEINEDYIEDKYFIVNPIECGFDGDF